jgi:hypothetical protein
MMRYQDIVTTKLGGEMSSMLSHIEMATVV